MSTPLTEQPTISTGHLFFADGYEYFKMGNDIVRATINSPLGADRRRLGYRFECYAHLASLLRSLMSQPT